MPTLNRSAGILLHPTSLPGNYCVGEIGAEAHRWLEILAEAGQTIWQVLPLGPTGYGNSPYQSPSTFAGNPLLIAFDLLLEDGLLEEEDLKDIPWLDPQEVDFGAAVWYRPPVLRLACARFLQSLYSDKERGKAYREYCDGEADWLDDYALFTALKGAHDLRPWYSWPEPLAQRDADALAKATVELSAEIEEVKVQQFLFDQQWRLLKEKAAGLGITIVGDIPIFVAHDSADVWASRDLFTLDDGGIPTVVAGVPPDYFSTTGQLWGNPLYAWERHGEDDFAWWKKRLRQILKWVDLVRIDHFRGFAAYWEIPAGEETAINGKWVEAPGRELFDSLVSEFGENLPIIAEDLGIITPDVEELRDDFNLPGMRVLQFAFGADSLAEDYIPENYPPNSVAYTGTHDNDTTVGLFRSEAGEGTTRSEEDVAAEQKTILGYFKTDGSEIEWDYIRAILRSKAGYAISPLQDVMGLGSEARMNTPGIAEDNWGWRFQWSELQDDDLQRLRSETEASERLP